MYTEMLNKYQTPILLLEEGINRIFIKRDDLIPFSFGGNKVRIAIEFFDDMSKKGYNCIIGYGNARSNLSRAIANMAAAKSIYCLIVSPSDEDGQHLTTGNSLLVEQCGADILNCSKNNVPKTIEKAFQICEDKGLRPYYINGDIFGRGNEEVPVRAYYKAHEEILRQACKMGIMFDYIFLACGTGMTLSGLIAGKRARKSKEQIIGISVARDKITEIEKVRNYLSAYEKTDNSKDDILITDSFLCGGYGKYNSEIITSVRNMFLKYGIPLDFTYTGKAWWGMQQYLEKHKIKSSNILFLHTGGTPLFFDNIINVFNRTPSACNNIPKLVSFLHDIDHSLPVPLSDRVNLSEYAEKVIKNGKVFVIEYENEIKAAILFYCNNLESKTGYLTLLAVDKLYRGKGLASTLLDSMNRLALSEGMHAIELDVHPENKPALALYKKSGYNIINIDKKIHMRKELI